MSVSESEPLESFLYGIKSDTTKSKYKRILKTFFDYLEILGDLETQSKLFIAKANKKGNNWVSANLMKFLLFHKERVERGEITYGTVRNYYKPIKLFLEMNDIELSWKKITRGLPKGRKHAADRAPTITEIQKLIEYPDRRIKPIVFIMCSSGIRVGAWDDLKWSHVSPIIQDGKVVAAKLLVYAGYDEQYFTFISPEAFHELKKWMELRENTGEKITGDSWMMRDLWNSENYSRGLITVPKKLSSLGVKRLIERALKGQGIRKKLPLGQKRHEFQADHGFRKFFKTHAEQNMKPINVETLMGHSTGISDSYYRPNENELLNDYLKAIPELVILPENRQKLGIKKQEEIISELKGNQSKIKHLEEGVNILGALMAEQQVKNKFWRELDSPTHHHTAEQNQQLKEYCKKPPSPEVWKEFMEWAKKGSQVYSDS